jgi:cytidine deaminase
MITNNILTRAIKSAEKSNVIRGKVAAVAFLDNGTIISHAHNSSFLGSRWVKTIHAEEALLKKLDDISAVNRYGNNINILVVRWKKGLRMFGNAKPCMDCSKKLSEYPSFKIFYTNEDGIIEELL